jgi:hypothetical protein
MNNETFMAAIIEHSDVFEHNSISTSLSSLPMPMLSSLVKLHVHTIFFSLVRLWYVLPKV